MPQIQTEASTRTWDQLLSKLAWVTWGKLFKFGNITVHIRKWSIAERFSVVASWPYPPRPYQSLPAIFSDVYPDKFTGSIVTVPIADIHWGRWQLTIEACEFHENYSPWPENETLGL